MEAKVAATNRYIGAITAKHFKRSKRGQLTRFPLQENVLLTTQPEHTAWKTIEALVRYKYSVGPSFAQISRAR